MVRPVSACSTRFPWPCMLSLQLLLQLFLLPAVSYSAGVTCRAPERGWYRCCPSAPPHSASSLAAWCRRSSVLSSCLLPKHMFTRFPRLPATRGLCFLLGAEGMLCQGGPVSFLLFFGFFFSAACPLPFAPQKHEGEAGRWAAAAGSCKTPKAAGARRKNQT